MKKLILALLLAASSAFGAESFLQLPTDAPNTGKMLRTKTSVQGANTVHSQGFFLDNGAGGDPLGVVTNPLFVTFTNTVLVITGTVGISGTVPVSGPLTDAQLRATPVPVSGTVAVSGTVPVSGTFWQATQPVSGSLSVSNFPGSQAVTGAFFQTTQPVSGTFWQTTQPVSGPLTDTQLRASAVPVTANAGTNLNTSALALEAGHLATIDTSTAKIPSQGQALAAASLPVVLTAAQVTTLTPPATVALGAGAAVIGHVINDAGAAVIGHVIADTGSTTAVTGNVTVAQATGTNLHAVLDNASIAVIGVANTITDADSGSATAMESESYGMNYNGATWDRIRGDTTSGQWVNVKAALPAGTNVIGHVINDAGAAVIGHVIVDTGSTTAVTGNVTVTALGATNAAITQNPNLGGVEALSSQPAAATDGNKRQIIGSLDGAQYVREGGPVSWTCGLAALAASLTQCRAAPAAGLSLYVTDIIVQTSTTTAGTFGIQYGTGTNCVTGPAALFPVSATTSRWTAPISTAPTSNFNFKIPLKAAAANAICVIGTATNTINIQINGFTGP